MTVDLGKTSVEEIPKMGRTTVGTTAVRAIGHSGLVRGLLLLAMNSNAETVYVGMSDSVTVNNGFPLIPGAAVEMPFEDGTAIYLVSSASNQEVAWIAQ